MVEVAEQVVIALPYLSEPSQGQPSQGQLSQGQLGQGQFSQGQLSQGQLISILIIFISEHVHIRKMLPVSVIWREFSSSLEICQ